MTRIKLVFASDERYFPGLVGTLSSILLSTSAKNFDIYIIDGGIAERNKQELKRILGLFKVSADPIYLKPDLSSFSRFPAFFYESLMAYSRLLIPELISEKRVIYIDTDILFTKDIKELWEVDLAGKSAGVALEFALPKLGLDCKICEKLNIDPEAPNFNSGILLLDLDEIRKKDIMIKTIMYLNEFPEHCKYWDQSALNITLFNDFVLLDQSWNTQSHKVAFNLASDFKKLDGQMNYHFVTSFKPWLSYGDSLPERMFIYLIKQLNFNFETKRYKKSKVIFEIKKWFLWGMPGFYKLRGTIKGILNRNSEMDFKIGRYWEEKNKEEKELKSVKKEIDLLFEKWKTRTQLISKVI